MSKLPVKSNIVGGKQVRSLASLSIEKMYKQRYFDETGMAQDYVEEFRPCVSNFKMPVLNDSTKLLSKQVELLR